MKLVSTLLLLLFVTLCITTSLYAQGTNPDPVQNAENLRAQLREVEEKQAGLQARLQQLDEQLKPENIERSLAGVGSTRPEELRELRRRQLTIEKDSVLGQLEVLKTSHARLESAVVNADALVYQQSAQGSLLNKFGLSSNTIASRPGALLLAVLIAVAGSVGIFALRKRARP
jgi:hypothetical protein